MANKHHEDFWVTAFVSLELMAETTAQQLGIDKFRKQIPEDGMLDYLNEHAIVWKLETRKPDPREELWFAPSFGRPMIKTGVELDEMVEIKVMALLPQSRAVEFRMREFG